MNNQRGNDLLLREELAAARDAFGAKDTRELNPLQMAYVGDTVHDLYVRSLLLARGMTVGRMHRQAVRMVSAHAQAKMLEAIEPELTDGEADVARRGRNAQAKHAAPKNADPADYSHATGLEALWGYLYLSGQTQRLDELMKAALSRTEELWQKQSSR
ncbi:MAG: ribonuclease III [Clostridia bacterium]|nr:ribonuclease III [Clostridia bacterium]MBQ6859762.1 ribonuclease III [Clostridia bacterium]